MPAKPNIVLIECDSMDGRVMSCLRHLAAYTPNLDQLAERGVVFRNAYCNSPQCCPSRASRWSGRHIHEIEAWNNHKGIEPGAPTYLTHLENAGYRTQVFGKTDYVSGGHSLGARVYAWTRAANIRLPQKPLPTSQLTHIPGPVERVHERDWKHVDDSIAWLQGQAKNEVPFFLNCSVGIPHPAFVSSDWWLDKIDPDRVTIPRKSTAERHPVMDYMSTTKNCAGAFDEEDVLAIRRTYYAMVAELDAMVGHIFRAVSDLGLLDRTYIIFMSDHGEMNMEHDQWLKNAPYEASVRVPLIISGPGVEENKVMDDLVSLVDFYPTLMDMAGLPRPEDLDGDSLMPALSGRSSQQRVLCQYHSNFANTGIFILRRGPWKYIAYPGFEPQLFNLDNDPAELKNLAKDKRETVRNMDRALRRMIDYPAVDTKAKAYDRDCFLKWERSLGKEKCRETLADLFHAPWTDEHTDQLETWLKG